MKLYLNNVGIINALGSDKKTMAEGLLSTKREALTRYDKLFSGHVAYVGKVKSKLVSLPEFLGHYQCRNNQMLATAYEQIREDVETLIKRYGSTRVGIVLGTSTSGIRATEIAMRYKEKYGEFPDEFEYSQQEIGTSSNFLAEYTGIKGIHYTVSTACSSSGKAFSAAKRLIETDLCDAVVVGGSDTLCRMTLNGFDCLDLASPDVCQPFSKNRKGLNIGEGAALFVMSKLPSEIALTGVGETSDGYHISAPDPSAEGAIKAMKQALKMANRIPEEIGYINTHGTATHKNDEAEAKAIHDVFGHETPCSSLKSQIGHILGASAAHELAACWLLLSDKYNPDRMLPPHLWDGEYDDKMEMIRIVKESESYLLPVMLSNSFAFGGSNVSLVVEHSKIHQIKDVYAD